MFKIKKSILSKSSVSGLAANWIDVSSRCHKFIIQCYKGRGKIKALLQPAPLRTP